MKQLAMILLMLTAWSLPALASKGKLSGTVYDETKEPLIGAIVQVFLNSAHAGSCATDVDGKYMIKDLSPATNYVVRVSYASYKMIELRNVVISPDRTTYQNFNMEVSAAMLEEVVVKEYKMPLIKKDQPGTSTTYTAEQIARLPTRKTGDVASLSADKFRREGKMSVAGARTGGTVYIVDGVQSSGHRMDQSQPVYYNPSEESYAKVREKDFLNVKSNPLSTLSVDVDRASYSNVRRFINQGQRPPADAVRIEEMVNYFHYNYPEPEGEDPITIATELTRCPWNEDHQLLRIGMQARNLSTRDLPPSNLVFLVDVSGSMATENKLPLVKSSLRMLVRKLRARDRVSIVVYAGSAGLVLPSTPGSRKEVILEAIERLEAGGSTAGGAGIKLAYQVAEEHFVEGGNNRVILATDGDFNVGVSADNELETLITKERSKGIFLTCLGYGMGNYKDSKLETLADKGNGNYAYIDNTQEAYKTLVTEFGGTLFTVAKDVKAQIEFNPTKVQGYRLVGYENRLLNEEDFRDDKKDAGEMGAGHQVTILYEIVPAGVRSRHIRSVTDLRYQRKISPEMYGSLELATVKFRYKTPEGFRSREISHVINAREKDIEACSDDTRFAASVALFGMLLRDSRFAPEGDMAMVRALARKSLGVDEEGYRADFLRLLKQTTSFSFRN